MFNIFKIFVFAYLFLCFLTKTSYSQQQTSKDVVFKMLKSIHDLDRAKWSLKIIERGKNGFNNYESSVKLNKSPRKIYIYIKGIEVLWVNGWNGNKAYVKPNSFPYVNLSLDPLGFLMRQDQHHTLNEMGFDYFGSIIQYIAVKVGDKFDTHFKLEGEERHNNRPCYKVTIKFPEFGYENYTVGENESITSIARKLHVSEYMILEANPKLKDYFDILKKGQVLRVPNAYAKDVTLWIDQLYNLPVGIKILDDKGLFEQYDYFFLQVNPKFEDDEFTKTYKDYKF